MVFVTTVSLIFILLICKVNPAHNKTSNGTSIPIQSQGLLNCSIFIIIIIIFFITTLAVIKTISDNRMEPFSCAL